MKKSAILILSLGPIFAAGCMSGKSSTPTARAPTTQPSAVVSEPIEKATGKPVAPTAMPATPTQTAAVAPMNTVTSTQAPSPVIPAPPATVAWDAPVDGRPVCMTLRAEGVQIYECKKTDAGFAWDLKAPEALLYNDKGRNVGKHSAGPTWEYSDGSKIVGEKIASSPHEGAVPLLLIKVNSTSGTGKLNGVKYVKRTDTWGGTAPTAPADAAHAGKTETVPYRATYVFYAGN